MTTLNSNDQYAYGLDPAYVIEPGELNTNLIYDMVCWAEKKEERRQIWEKWGEWRQGVWADWVPGHAVDLTNLPDNLTLGMVQEKNVCGTAFCMAGQAAAQAGYEFIGLGNGWTSVQQCIKVEPTNEFDERGNRVMEEVGEPQNISQVGMVVLGLSPGEANMFFGGDNPIEYLKSLTNGICESRNLPVLFPDAQYPAIYAGYEDWLDVNDLIAEDFEAGDDD